MVQLENTEAKNFFIKQDAVATAETASYVMERLAKHKNHFKN